MGSWKDLQDSVKPTFDLVLTEASKQIELTPARAAEIVANAIPTQVSREQLDKFREYIGKLPSTLAATKAIHHFVEGLYIREYHQPAGTIVVGKKHRLSHMIVLVAGEVTMLTESGMQRLTAPWIERGSAGIQRIVVCHADCVILTTHPNPRNWDEALLGELEKELMVDPDTVIEGEFEQVAPV